MHVVAELLGFLDHGGERRGPGNALTAGSVFDFKPDLLFGSTISVHFVQHGGHISKGSQGSSFPLSITGKLRFRQADKGRIVDEFWCSQERSILGTKATANLWKVRPAPRNATGAVGVFLCAGVEVRIARKDAPICGFR